MERRNRTQLALGILLLLFGAGMIAVRQVPELQTWFDTYYDWPFGVIGAGAIIFVIGLLVGAPGMAVPASIVAGIGGILYYQNATGDWGSWSYMWSLIPGFVGVGSILAGLLGESTRTNLKHGLNLLVISAFLFLIFGSFLGGWALLGDFGPAILLILLGIYVIVRGLIRSTRRE
ncbi:MAG: hypothetical protein ACOYY3_00275 [Chloroflexota bacterium]